MKRILLAAILAFVITAHEAKAMPVFCTNCSDIFTQLLQQVNGVEQLYQLYEQVSQAMQQTQQQIQMVQTGFQQYQNMLQNTASLPSSVLGQLQGQFSQVSQLSKQLKVNRGDASALSQIFNKIYPPKSLTLPASGEAKPWKDPNQVGEEKDAIDQAAMDAQQAAFEVSGQQIDDIEQNADQLDTDVQQLMQTPDGQVKAVMAGNQLLGRLLQESQKLRQLFAVSTQAQAQQAMNARKEVLDQETWGNITKTDKLNAPAATTPAAGF